VIGVHANWQTTARLGEMVPVAENSIGLVT